MNSNLEKIYMNWILKNTQFFKIIEPHFFENENIGFVYKVIKNNFELNDNKEIPTQAEIINLVQIADKTGKIELGFIKALLKIDFEKDYTPTFIEPLFKAWVLSNCSINGLVESFEEIKQLDKTNLPQVEETIANIKNILDESFNVQLTKPSLGLDFDDPDSHNQKSEVNKITTGYTTLDTIMGDDGVGGWDRKTLNILMGGPGSGKSLWLQNFAVNAVDNGYNVAYISLELSDVKCMKRIGSMRLGIPIKDYTKLSKDTEYMRQKIESINNTNNSIFGKQPGKLFVQEYPSGMATLSDITRYLKLVKDEAGIDIDMLVIDYLQIMGTEKNIDRNMLYLKGEHLAVGLRSIAQKFNLVCLSATQISKEKYGALNIELNDIPESKAIADTADTVWAVILSPEMKKDGKYHLKHNKLRDNETEFERVLFHLDKSTLKIKNDSFISEQI